MIIYDEIANETDLAQRYFRRRLKEAKKVVNEPPQPRVKLTIGGKSPEPPPKITLKFGNPKPNHSSGVSVDTEALKRQQELVRAGVNGQGINTASTKPVTTERPSSGSEHGVVPNGIKREISQTHSPAPGPSQVNGVANASMPPPSHLNPRVTSGSPMPQPTMTNGVTAHVHPITQFNNSFSRPPGKGMELDDLSMAAAHRSYRCIRRPHCESQSQHSSRLQSAAIQS